MQNIFERKTNEFIKLYFANDSIICTFEHPFFVNNNWKAAKDLKQGDSLFAYAGYKVALDSIYTFRTDTATAVYNLEAGGNHNYYVSADGVLVHNKNAVLAKMSGVLRDAAKGKGNFGLGSSTYKEAMEMGEAWIGEGFTTTSKGYFLSKDGIRLFRPPSFKPKLNIYQANFQYKVNGQVTKQWLSNGHLNIIK